MSFVYEGNHFLKSTLANVRSILLKQVNAYRELEMSKAAERRAAIDKIFEEAGKKPSTPKMKDRTFKLSVTWLDLEEPDGLEISALASVRAAEPDKVAVSSIARLRETAENVTVTLAVEGVMGKFDLAPSERSVDCVVRRFRSNEGSGGDRYSRCLRGRRLERHGALCGGGLLNPSPGALYRTACITICTLTSTAVLMSVVRHS